MFSVFSENTSLGKWLEGIDRNLRILSQNSASVSSLVSGNQTYSLGTKENLQFGEFFYDSVTEELILNPPTTEPIFYVEPQNLELRTTNVCDFPVPQFLKDWNVQGNLNISRNFGSHPSLSMSFEIYCNQEQQVRNQLCVGTKVFIWQEWRINSVSFVQSLNKDNLQVNLDLIGIHAPYGDPSRSRLDKPIKLIQGKYKKYRTLGGFAIKAGVAYQGANISKRISRNTTGKEFTTFRQEIESKAILSLGFVYYDNSDRVEIRKWNSQATNLIIESEVVGDISYSFNGTEPSKLAHELRNVILNLDFDEDEKGQNAGVITRWEFDNADSFADVVDPKIDKGSYSVAANSDELRSSSATFDNGGRTKTARKFTEYNGVPLSSEQWVYGYAYTSLDTYRVLDLSNDKFQITFKEEDPRNYWQEVNHSKTNHTYNEEGYLISLVTTGKEIARFKQESESLEAINLRLQAIQAGLDSEEGKALLDQTTDYTFVESLPINETTDYTLEAFRKHYDDISLPEENNVDWVEPRFNRRKTRSRDNFLIKENPESTEELTLPSIVTGKFQKETETISITNTGKPERFNRKAVTLSQEGENFKNAVSLSSFSQNIGRPPIHTRLERNLDDLKTNGNYERYRNYKFWLSTGGSGSDFKNEESSKSYPDIDNPGQARAIAKTELSIKNSKDTEILNLTILWRDDLEIGNAIVFRGVKYILFSMRENLTIEQNGFTSQGIELTLGRYITTPVNLRRTKNKT